LASALLEHGEPQEYFRNERYFENETTLCEPTQDQAQLNTEFLHPGITNPGTVVAWTRQEQKVGPAHL
jgi:hypothetical protein